MRLQVMKPGAIPGNIEQQDLQALVGGRLARIVYAGRSGCCAGMDEIVFEVPAGIEGCNVPVWDASFRRHFRLILC